MWRLQKQLFIVFLFLSALMLIVIGIFYMTTTSEASCFDNIQNQGEEDIDCGGPCVPCSIKHLNPLEINYIQVLKTGEALRGLLPHNIYDIVARVRNVNAEWGAKTIYYKFDFFDEFENPVGTFSGKTFILPAEVKYIIALNVESEEPIKRVTLNISYSQDSWDMYGPIKNPLRVQSQQLNKNVVSALIVNDNSFALQGITVYAFALDSGRKPVGVGKTVINSLPAFSNKEVKITLPFSSSDGQKVQEGDYGRWTIEVVPEVDVYNLYAPKRSQEH